MAELVLTPERRDELAALLDDEQRLRAEYPKVVEYLDTAPRLPGTGNRQADAAFDLRFVHYMTGGKSKDMNPYWDIVAPLVYESEGRRLVNGGRPDGSPRLTFAEIILQATYAYAIPSPDTIEWISCFCNSRRLVELGAGRGYWAAQLARAGLAVDAYDFEPPDSAENTSFPQTAGQFDVWHPVGGMGDFAARGVGSDDVLLLCWPPGWGNPMASQALTAFEQSGGKQLIYIGEPKGGKTGDDAFFDALSAGWDLKARIRDSSPGGTYVMLLRYGSAADRRHLHDDQRRRYAGSKA